MKATLTGKREVFMQHRVNSSLVAGAVAGTMALSILGAGTATAAPAGTTGTEATTTKASSVSKPLRWIELRHGKYLGRSCGKKSIAEADGHGKTTLKLNFSRSVETAFSTETGFTAGEVSGSVGTEVRKSHTVEIETRFEVPRGRVGHVRAYPKYKVYKYDGYMKAGGTYLGKATVGKPIGICFKEWTTKA
ncbi:hypothetical protein MQE23_43205 [Streptomyces sp. HP-A2021]|uniref:hypothetical protein n=1 Tax=Streptomyces sp. HP-A2021 TaxID=2927875 RepID=UPI001FB0134E|nr:hypothetical protein [Streptomyces sp. HP-A2021]UOB15419.1 hypothetical protein MQE23_43205 [Streptomyces sp. HP-A2021]